MIRTTRILLTFYVLILSRIEAIIFGFNPIFGNSTVNDYQVYWNVPTFMCHKYNMTFDEVSRDFGIVQNPKDQFRGDEIAILYDPGMFPALLKAPDGSKMIRNGGVPQEGNLTRHLELFTKHVVEQITNVDFRGLGIIDFESWRPIFRQNWASLAPYRDYSIEIETKKHPSWATWKQRREAINRFESSGKIFMEETLKTAVALRPRATWGYYAYPYCFNLSPAQPNSRCDIGVSNENDQLSWLFKMEKVLLPSVYLRKSLNDTAKIGLIRGRVEEAIRIARKTKPRAKILPYFWYQYQDKSDVFLSKNDAVRGLREISELGADGCVIWGSSNDVNSKEKCRNFRNYLNNVLGPAIVESKNTVRPRMPTDRKNDFSIMQDGDGDSGKNFESGNENSRPSVIGVL